MKTPGTLMLWPATHTVPPLHRHAAVHASHSLYGGHAQKNDTLAVSQCSRIVALDYVTVIPQTYIADPCAVQANCQNITQLEHTRNPSLTGHRMLSAGDGHACNTYTNNVTVWDMVAARAIAHLAKLITHRI
jgi:hypothetical protein